MSQLSATLCTFTNKKSLGQCSFWNKTGETCRNLYSSSVEPKGDQWQHSELAINLKMWLLWHLYCEGHKNATECKTKIYNFTFVNGSLDLLKEDQTPKRYIFCTNATVKCPQAYANSKIVNLTPTLTAAAKRATLDISKEPWKRK